ncbi:putative kinesin, partial [Aspergillus campestris IBT 28561]
MPFTFTKPVHLPQEGAEETPLRPVLIAPFPRNPDFVGHDTLLNELHRRGDVPGSRIALIGLGGVGKTQLAAEYTYSIRDRSPETSVFWVPAGDAGSFEQGCRDIANRLKIPGRQDPTADICELLHVWLQDERNGKWVLVLDNWDDGEFLRKTRPAEIDDLGGESRGMPGQSFWSYFCEGLKGSIVITTRNRGVTSMVEDSNVLHVTPMNNDQAITLFEKKCNVQADREEVVQPVTAQDFMPLAITQAATYINFGSRRLSAPGYLEVIPKYKEVFTTWKLIFDRIRETQPSAADLLCVMSFFDADGIPDHVFRQNETGYNIRGLPTYDRDRVNNGGDGEESTSETSGLDLFEDDISLLRISSLISVSADKSTFGMHRVVQRITLNWLEANQQIEEYKERFIRILWSNFPSGRLRNSSRCESLFAHVLCAAAQRPNAEASLGQWASLLHEAASFAITRGIYADSTKLAGEAFSARTELFGIKNEQTLNSSQVLALSYSLEGRWNEAQELQEHPSRIYILTSRATEGGRRASDSGDEHEQAILGPEHPNALLSMDNLASLYITQGNWTAAKQLLMQVIQIKKQVLGSEHPSTLLGMDNLASLYMRQEEWTATKQLLLQVIEIRKQALGPDHLDTL